MKMSAPTISVSPLDALMAHFDASSKSVQRAFAKIIIERRAHEFEVARQKAMIREDLSQAAKELKAGESRPISCLFE